MNESTYFDLLALKAKGQLRDTLDIIIDIESDITQQSSLFFAKISILKAEICIELGWLEEAKAALNRVLELDDDGNSNQVAAKIHAEILMVEITRLKGLDDSIESTLALLIQKLEHLSFGLPTRANHKLLFLAQVEYGEYKAREGQLDKAINLLTQAVSMVDATTTEDASEIEKKLHVLNRIGKILMQRGDIQKGFNYIQNALQLLENNATVNQFPNELAHAYDSMAIGFARLGHLTRALQFSKDCLKIAEKTDISRHHAEFLFTQLLMSLREKDLESFELSFSKLESLAIQSEIEEIKQLHLLVTAIKQKMKKRLDSITDAQANFKELLQRPTVNYEIKVATIMNLIGIHIGELVMTSNLEIFNDLNLLIEDLKAISEINDNQDLLTKIMILQAKIAMFEKDMTKSKRYLNGARQIAVKQNDKFMEQKIAENQDTLLTLSISPWINHDVKTGYEALIEILNIEDFLTFIPFITLPNVRVEDEKPIWLIIIRNGGLNVYSQTFDPNLDINEQFISGLIAAIDILGKESMPRSDSIERIIYQDYKIVIKRSNGLLFCYAFSKQSYPALQKLDDFITTLKEKTDLWEVLDREIPFLTEDETTTLRNLAEMIFQAR